MAKRIGLIGCGVVADYGHLPAIQATKGLELAAIFDPDPRRLKAAKDKFHVPLAFTSVDDFFASPIDAVVVTSPAPAHYQNIADAARHRKHVLCEKPLGMTALECERMIDIAQDAGIMLFTAFDYRFSPVSQTIRRLVADGAVGPVRSLRLIYIWHMHGKYVAGPDGQRTTNPRGDGRMREGGPMVDCGVHQIDLARWWTGSEVVRWTGAGAWVDQWQAPDHMWLHMDHQNKAHTMVEISYSYCYTAAEPIARFTYELIGADGIIRYDREAKVFEVRSSGGTRNLEFAGEKNFAGMYDEFAKALATGEPGMMPTGADGLAATRISREATESVIRGRV